MIEQDFTDAKASALDAAEALAAQAFIEAMSAHCGWLSFAHQVGYCAGFREGHQAGYRAHRNQQRRKASRKR